jgi:AraC-like DNA-binding protein
MDKNTKVMTNSPPVSYTQRIPPGEKEIHRRYGLRITHFQRHGVGRAREDIRPRTFEFFSLCHLYEGRGWFWTEGADKVEVKTGDGVLVTPGTLMDYAAVDGPWVEDYICFTGPVADHLQTAGVLSTGVLKIGRNRRLPPLIEQALDPSENAQIAANSLLQKLLVDLYLENRPAAKEGGEQAVADLLRLLSRQVERWWTVEEMASHCEMSLNHFRNTFRQQTGMAPKAYLEHLKMTQAGERLCRSEAPVARIAKAFGYRDPYHFSRAFKRVMGLAPTLYRAAYRL